MDGKVEAVSSDVFITSRDGVFYIGNLFYPGASRTVFPLNYKELKVSLGPYLSMPLQEPVWGAFDGSS